MNENERHQNAEELVERLRRRPELKTVPDIILKAVADEIVKTGQNLDAALEIAARDRALQRSGAAGDSLGNIVQQGFEGATQDIAGRHQVAVREEKLRRIIAGVLEGLGGRGATLGGLLRSAGGAVSDSVSQGLGGVPVSEIERQLSELRGKTLSPADADRLMALVRDRPASNPLDGPSTAQLAHAVSQAVQQVALNVQKILTVALDAERAADAENPRNSSP